MKKYWVIWRSNDYYHISLEPGPKHRFHFLPNYFNAFNTRQEAITYVKRRINEKIARLEENRKELKYMK